MRFAWYPANDLSTHAPMRESFHLSKAVSNENASTLCDGIQAMGSEARNTRQTRRWAGCAQRQLPDGLKLGTHERRRVSCTLRRCLLPSRSIVRSGVPSPCGAHLSNVARARYLRDSAGRAALSNRRNLRPHDRCFRDRVPRDASKSAPLALDRFAYVGRRAALP